MEAEADYTWRQTPEDVTVNFTVPGLTRDRLQYTLTASTVHLTRDDDESKILFSGQLSGLIERNVRQSVLKTTCRFQRDLFWIEKHSI